MKKLRKKFQNEIIGYLEFKLNKELCHEDTFGKDDKIRKEYEEYVNSMTELSNIHFEIIDRNRARRREQMKKKDKERFEKLKQIGCIACQQKGIFTEPIIHHIRKFTGLSLRPPHDKTIPLCPEHHNMGNESVHLNKKKFEELFGTELHLLDKTNQQIKELEKGDIFYGETD